MRSIVIGDIHGCDRALRGLLGKVKPDAGRDRLILLGDLFDRGPDSWAVFQTVRRLSDAFGDRFVLLRGNHEDYLLRPKMSLLERLLWERVGRQATVKSFKAHGERPEGCAPWLKAHTRLFFRGEGFQCVHAGLKVDPIEVNDAQTLMHDHEIVLQNRYVGPLTIVGHIALTEPTWFAGDGQTTEALPYGAWRALPEMGILCIDTGCGKGGSLTAMTIEGGRFTLDRVGE